MRRLDTSITSQSLRNMNIDELGGIFLETTNKLTYTQVLDWLPGTEKALIFENNPDTLETRLSLWDVNQNLLTTLAPHGVDGQFSPNGHFLAYITRDLIQSRQEDKPMVPPQQTDFTHQLHLFDMTQEQLTFSTPISIENKTRQPQYPYYQSLTTFSPDSQYLTFFTPNKIGVDDQSNTGSAEGTTNGDIFYLNILDTTHGNFINSTPSGLVTPIWSPNSGKLVYRDELDDWVIFSIANRNFTVLTQSGGVRVDNLQWSFDGSYLSVQFFAKGDMPWERIFQTAIFQVPED